MTEPDQPHGHPGGGRLPGSLAERHDTHQHGAERACRPGAVIFDTAIQVAAAPVLVRGRMKRWSTALTTSRCGQIIPPPP